MPSQFSCPQCRQVLRSPQPIAAGTRVKCNHCGAVFPVGATPAVPEGAANPFADFSVDKPKVNVPPAPAPVKPVPRPQPVSDNPFADFGAAEPPAEEAVSEQASVPPRRQRSRGMSMKATTALACVAVVVVGAAVGLGLKFGPWGKKQEPVVAQQVSKATPPKTKVPAATAPSKPDGAKSAALPELQETKAPVNPPPDSPMPSAEPPREAMASFDDWLQDFEAAKKKAKEEKKDIFVLFDGSDWCGFSIRMARETFFQKEFRDAAHDRFVLVFVDFPKKQQAKDKVQDGDRNTKLAHEFHVGGYPHVVLTDSDGLAVGFIEGYVQGGAQACLDLVTTIQERRKTRDELLAKIAAAQGPDKLPAAREAVDFLVANQLLEYHAPLLRDWIKLAHEQDPNNERGDLETFFELEWRLALLKLEQNDAKGINDAVGTFDDWKKKHKFRNANRGARLHLLAARLLALGGDPDRALEYAEAGIAYKPSDKELALQLARAHAALGPCLGTGFVVADGYVLTNHHVIEGRQDVRLRFDKVAEPIDGKVVAEDAERDLALIRFAAKAGMAKPVALATARALNRGEKVGALGYALESIVGSGVKLTTGVVSAVPDKSTDNMLLLDCRVNPGNSGGPLCDSYGCVAGVVTAKSTVGAGLDSYGMARAAADFHDFLKTHVKDYKSPPAGKKKLEWDEVDQLVSPSVVMVMRGKE